MCKYENCITQGGFCFEINRNESYIIRTVSQRRKRHYRLKFFRKLPS